MHRATRQPPHRLWTDDVYPLPGIREIFFRFRPCAEPLAPLGPDLHVMPMTEITSRLSTALADRYRIERHLGEGGMATVEQFVISFLSIASVRRENQDNRRYTPLSLPRRSLCRPRKNSHLRPFRRS